MFRTLEPQHDLYSSSGTASDCGWVCIIEMGSDQRILLLRRGPVFLERWQRFACAWLLTDLQAAYANDAPPEWGKRNAIVMLGAGTVQIPDAHQVEAGTLAYARILKTFALYQACRKSGQRCTVIVSGGDAQHHGLFGSGGLWRHIARPGRCGFRAAA